MMSSLSVSQLVLKLTYQGIAKNTIYQLVGKVFTALSALLIFRLVWQGYSDSGVGELTTLVNYFNIFYLLSDFGINAIAVKQMVERPQDEARIFQSLLGFRLASGTLLLIVALLIAYLLPYNPTTGIGFSETFKVGVLLLGATIITQGIYLTTNTIFQKNKAYGASVLALSVGSVISALVFLFLSKSHVSFLLPLSGFLIGGLIAALLALYLVPLAMRVKMHPVFSWSQWKLLLLPSLPLAATLVLNVIYFKADSFILRSLMPLEDVGIYGTAYKVFDQAIVIPVFFVNALYPVLLSQYTSEKGKLPRTLFYSTGVLALAGVVTGGLMFLLAPMLVHLISDNTVAISPLKILALGLPFFFVSNVFLWLLVTLGKQKYLSFIYGGTMLFNIVANYLLIPKYSYHASAVLTGVSEAIVLALTMGFGLYFLNKKLKEGT